MTDVRRLAGAQVLVIGDVMLDEYLWGDVHRISPEAPVPVIEVQRRTHVAGGAANTAMGVAALEGRAALGGVVGTDVAADRLRSALASAGIDAAGLMADADRPTTTKTRMIAHAQQMLRADSEDRSPIAAAIEASVTDWFHGRSEPVEAVVISDYGKGVVSERLAAKVIAEANRRGAPVVVDSKARDFGRYRGAAVVTPNQHDAARAARMPIESDEDLAIAAEQLSGDSGGAAILVTRGADGMTLFSDRGSMHVAAEARDVFDVTGAGDTVVAVLAVALARGVQLEDAVRLANTAAGIVVSKIGTSTVSLDELERGT